MSRQRQSSATTRHVEAMRLALAENLSLDEANARLVHRDHEQRMARLRRKGWHE